MRCLSNDAWHFGYARDWTPGELTSAHAPATQRYRSAALQRRPKAKQSRSAYSTNWPKTVSQTPCVRVPMAHAERSPAPDRSTMLITGASRCARWRACMGFRTGSIPSDEMARCASDRKCGTAAACPSDCRTCDRSLGSGAARPRRSAFPWRSICSRIHSEPGGTHFGVEAPSSRRDRKSGRQSDGRSIRKETVWRSCR